MEIFLLPTTSTFLPNCFRNVVVGYFNLQKEFNMETISLNLDLRDSPMFQEIIERLNRMEKLLIDLKSNGGGIAKKVLSFDEGAEYLGVSKSHLYKLTSSCKIPHYKPNGKHIKFDTNELDDWMKQNRIKTIKEIDQEASSYIIRKGRKY